MSVIPNMIYYCRATYSRSGVGSGVSLMGVLPDLVYHFRSPRSASKGGIGSGIFVKVDTLRDGQCFVRKTTLFYQTCIYYPL